MICKECNSTDIELCGYENYPDLWIFTCQDCASTLTDKTNGFDTWKEYVKQNPQYKNYKPPLSEYGHLCGG